jgi:hypothetical protein
MNFESILLLATLLTLLTAHSEVENLQNYRSILDTFNIPVNGMDKYELLYLYWIPKFHKNPLQTQ